MRPMTPELPDEEELMRTYLSEAGDPSVEPPPEHVAGLRSLLLERVAGTQPVALLRRRPWKSRLVVGSALAATALGVALFLMQLYWPTDAWAQVARALQQRSWIHGKITNADGKELGEEWLSSNRELSAERAGPEIRFHDDKLKLLTKYVVADDTIYRLPEPADHGPQGMNTLRQLLDLLLDPKGPARFPFPGMELIGQTRETIKDGEKNWIDIELTLRVAGGSRGEDLSMWIRIDSATNLPHRMVVDDEDGSRLRIEIDYPERGPKDIYDLGVPRTAKVIDRLPQDGVTAVLAGLREGRRRFDDYCAYVVEERVLPAHRFPRIIVYRVWRKEPNWRIEELRPKARGWEPPADADLAWWKAHQTELEFIPRMIGNAEMHWDYYLTEVWHPGLPVPKVGEKTEIGQTIGPNPMQGPPGDPMLPFWCQDIFPEQTGHPTAGIGGLDNDREFLVEPNAKGGPPGTILFRGRDTNPRAKGLPDYFRLWIDRDAKFLVRRSELRVQQSPGRGLRPQAGAVPLIEFVDIHTIETDAKSPKGYGYPTRSRHSTDTGRHEFVRTFYVDFQAELTDALFEPLK